MVHVRRHWPYHIQVEKKSFLAERWFCERCGLLMKGGTMHFVAYLPIVPFLTLVFLFNFSLLLFTRFFPSSFTFFSYLIFLCFSSLFILHPLSFSSHFFFLTTAYCPSPFLWLTSFYSLLLLLAFFLFPFYFVPLILLTLSSSSVFFLILFLLFHCTTQFCIHGMKGETCWYFIDWHI
jgi:hypothetical protein